MTIKKVHIEFALGHLQPDRPIDGAGLWRLRDNSKKFLAPEIAVTTAVRPCNFDSSVDVAALVKRLAEGTGPDEIWLVGYSWGCGEFTPLFCQYLAKVGLKVQLAFLIDPVIYGMGGFFDRLKWSYSHTPDVFPVPDNVENVELYRTTNVPWGFPYSRDVGGSQDRVPQLNVLRRVLFGTDFQANVNPSFEYFVDRKTKHDNIDDSDIVQLGILWQMTKRVGKSIQPFLPQLLGVDV